MKMYSDLASHVDAVINDAEVDDLFIIIVGKSATYFGGKAIGPDIISALAKTIVEQEGGLSAINRMQLAIFKAKELAKELVMKKIGLTH